MNSAKKPVPRDGSSFQRNRRGISKALFDLRKMGESFANSQVRISRKHDNADFGIGDRRDVKLSKLAPVHFDEFAPRLACKMLAKCEPYMVFAIAIESNPRLDAGTKSVSANDPVSANFFFTK